MSGLKAIPALVVVSCLAIVFELDCFEIVILGPGNRYSQRFDEYIRANRERIMEFRRRHHAVLSTEGL